MSMADQRPSHLQWIWIIFLLPGCSDLSGTDPWVSGTVRLDKSPLECGTVLFHPENPEIAPQMAEVNDGAFELRMAPGRYRVEIQASRQVPGKTGKYGEPIYESLIPDRYGQHSTLTADVASEGPHELSFALESSPADPRNR